MDINGVVIVSSQLLTLIPPDQCGTPTPTNASLTGALFFTSPLFLAGTTSRTMTRFLERLGLREHIIYVPNVDRISSPCVLKLAQSNYTFSIPKSNWDGSDVDILFNRGPGVTDNETVIDIPTKEVIVSSLYEDTPLQKFEWIKFVAAFFNLEASANAIFDAGKSTYDCNVQSISASLATFGGKKPTVAWVGYNVKDNNFITEDWTYKSQIIKDAGGTDIVFPTKTLQADVKSLIRNADVLIEDTPNVARLSSILGSYGLTVNTTDGWSFVSEKRIYKVDKVVTVNSFLDDFSQSFWAMPDYILMDLIDILFPTFNPPWNTVWFRNIGGFEQQKVTNSSDCPNGDTASVFTASYPALGCIKATDVSNNVASNHSTTSAASSPAATTSAVAAAATSGASKPTESSSGTLSTTAIAASLGTLGAIAVIVVGVLLYRRSKVRGYMRDRTPAATPIVFSAGRDSSTVSAKLSRWTKMLSPRRRKADEILTDAEADALNDTMLSQWPKQDPTSAPIGTEKESLTAASDPQSNVDVAGTLSGDTASPEPPARGRWTKMTSATLMPETDDTEHAALTGPRASSS
ncbi:hypothetical protein HDU93_002678 [Gonapodya sp. JEL0774]|nr:hypothetical protein HDU93_002678 [Gonapodya sp. JEL0774]